MANQMTGPMAGPELMGEVRRLAGIAPHRLSADMTGAVPLTEAQARRVCSYLARRIELPGQGPAARQVPPPMSAFRALAVGFYATPSQTGNQDFDFWKVTRPESGKWAGLTFVRRVLGGGTGSEMRTERIENMPQRVACQAIVDYGTEQAQAKFAELLDRCVDCGRWLTNDLSRERKRGPECFGRSLAGGE